MLWNHNTTPPTALPEKGSTMFSGGKRVAWSKATPDEDLAAIGLYRQGADDPVPAGQVVDVEERVIRNGKSELQRTFKPAPPPGPPVPQDFPDGITAPRIETTQPTTGMVLVDAAGNKYTLSPVGNLPVLQQISASPERDKAEIEDKLHEVERKLNLAKARRGDAEAKKQEREKDEKRGKEPKVKDVLAELLERVLVLEEIMDAMRGEPLT